MVRCHQQNKKRSSKVTLARSAGLCSLPALPKPRSLFPVCKSSSTPAGEGQCEPIRSLDYPSFRQAQSAKREQISVVVERAEQRQGLYTASGQRTSIAIVLPQTPPKF